MSKANNSSLNKAKSAKQDEYYTLFSDIEKEMKNYDASLKDKVIFCNCDDPFESNFFRYFVLNFERIGLKRLIAIGYKKKFDSTLENQEWDGNASQTSSVAVINKAPRLPDDVSDQALDMSALFSIEGNSLTPLEDDGDFRSAESLAFLAEADVVVTNPPFSLFREFIALLVEKNKKFAIIGNMNAMSYRDIFPLIKEGKVWLGENFGSMSFIVPDHYGGEKRRTLGNIAWFTSMDLDKRHEALDLSTELDSSIHKPYDNYDAINVNKITEIPGNYFGVMGVPITFMDKHNPEQFEILGITKPWDNSGMLKKKYPRHSMTNRNGEKKEGVTTLNSAANIKLDAKPEIGSVTFYECEGEFFEQKYSRILIRRVGSEKNAV